MESCYWELLLSDLLLHCSASTQGGREKLEDKETGCTSFQQLVGLSGCIVPTGFASSQNETVAPSANKQAEIAIEKIDQPSES